MLKYVSVLFSLCMLFLNGCENTDVQTATDAGMDALRAVTLSDQDVIAISERAVRDSDLANRLAPPESTYSRRLQQLVGEHRKENNLNFTYGVYLSPEVNAFAMADGTIRVYSGLMDMLNDGELTFVIGHEMGHMAKNHIRKKIQLAYAASAVRKSIASQNNDAGSVARSLFGDLAQSLANAQFSQFEEKEADDYGLAFLKRQKVPPEHAVSALKKLAALGKDHSFLSSHPDSQKRAERLQAQLEGKAVSIEEGKQNLVAMAKQILENIYSWVLMMLSKLFA
ncbi:MAG TPA: M48 family metalloprotease [Thermodesulfobacteriota bacterium]|mgnify:FL=1|nr:M48 family metalloprotease [Thermodesulfobacteriota bacterium]HNU71377.1 M48 family metalloprotease [Thermodesulfobacteriota bacterium]